MKQVRRQESRRLSGKENNDRIRFQDRLQNNSMLPFHAANRKKRACIGHGWQQEPIAKSSP